MASSDDEYIDSLSAGDDDLGAHQVTRGGDYDTRSSGRHVARGGPGGGAQAGSGKSKARWEDIKRSWDNVVEGEDGSIDSTVTGLLEAGKRSRLLRDTTPLQRGIIRHVIVVLDMSNAMVEKDLRPTRYLLTIRYAKEFVNEFFEQNPISQLGLIGMRDGLAVRISDLSGNPSDHIAALEKITRQDPTGNPSLQNALDMCRAALYHTPSHGTREVLIIYGALISSDPGDIHQTITALVHDKIQVSVVGLAAKVAICSTLCGETNSGDERGYNVALNEEHFQNLFLAATHPPMTRSSASASAASSLLMMGFPSRVIEDQPSLCSCHSTPTRGGYLCSRCTSKVCSLPAECPACSLTLILSTHLARSYHHLFPLKNWKAVSWREASKSSACFACLTAFPPVPADVGSMGGSARLGTSAAAKERRKANMAAGTSESQRYKCESCGEHFCIDCDVYAHEVLHNCPSCQSRSVASVTTGAEEDGIAVNGNRSGVNGSSQSVDAGPGRGEPMDVG